MYRRIFFFFFCFCFFLCQYFSIYVDFFYLKFSSCCIHNLFIFALNLILLVGALLMLFFFLVCRRRRRVLACISMNHRSTRMCEQHSEFCIIESICTCGQNDTAYFYAGVTSHSFNKKNYLYIYIYLSVQCVWWDRVKTSIDDDDDEYFLVFSLADKFDTENNR